MPRKNNPIVLRKKCPLCPNGEWRIKHFNGREDCTRYASCSCGGQVRADENQSMFYEEEPVKDTPTDTGTPEPQENQQPEQDPVPNEGEGGKDDEEWW